MKRFLSKLSEYLAKKRKILVPFSIGIILILGPAILFLHKNAKSVAAAWFDDNWQYRQQLTFSYTSDISSPRRVTITIDTSSLGSKIQSSCADARFTSANGGILQYQLTSSCGISSTTFDVIFPTINNGTNYGYFYYGNPTASSLSTNVSAFTALLVSGGTATKIDDASNFGAIPGGAQHVVRTSTGTLYAAVNHSTNLEIWKSSDGTSWTQQDSAHKPTIDSASPMAIAIDSANIIHIAYSGGNLEYITFTTSTNLFGSSAIIGSVLPIAVAIAVDSADKPHIFSADDNGSQTSVDYFNKVSGSWSAGVTPKTDTFDVTMFSPTITINNNNVPQCAFLYSGGLYVEKGNQNNASSFSEATPSGSPPVTDQSINMGIVSSTGDGDTWISYLDGSNHIAIRKHIAGDAWSTWQTALTDNNTGKEPTLAIKSSDIYVFYQNSSNAIVYDKYNGSWLGETTLQSGTLQDAHVRYSNYANASYDSYGMDYLYSDNTDVYWASLGFGPAVTMGTEAKGPGPVASYKFDEANGTTIHDATSNANNGVLGYFTNSGLGNYIIRQEINIIDGVAGGGSGIVLGADGYVQLDTTQYVNPTYYFETNISTSAGGSTITLRRLGTTTDDASVSGTPAILVRSSSFSPPAGQTVYGIFSSNTTVRVSAARIIVIDNTSTLTKTETQIEVGNKVTNLGNTTPAAVITNPKYWTYTSANWDATVTFYAEVTYSTSTTQTATISLQEDDGSFGGWADIKVIVSAVSNTSPTRTRSTSFTPTATGRHYRIAGFESSATGGRVYAVYNAKVIVDQSSSPTKFEPQYLLLNTADSGSTGLQAIPQEWISTEWANVTNAYYYAQDATNASDASKLQDIDNSNADITNATATGANQQIAGTAFTMPTSTHKLEVNVTNTTGVVGSGRIIVVSSLGITFAAPTWKLSDSCISNSCLYFDGSTKAAKITNSPAIDFDTGLSSGVTFSTWIKANSTGFIFNKGANTYMKLNNLLTGSLDLVASLDLGTTDATVTIAGGISENVWHHVEMAYTDDSDDEISIYIDGSLSGTSTNGVGSPATSDTNNLFIGLDSTSTNLFTGNIDEFKVYNFERTQAQVATDFAARGTSKNVNSNAGSNDQNLNVLSNGLLAYWNMDVSSGNPTDSSGNSNSLINTGTTGFTTGVFGNSAGTFDGSTKFFTSTFTSTNVQTVAFWVNPASTTDNYINLLDISANNYYIKSTSGTITATGFTSPTIFVNGVLNGTVTASVWNHIVVTSTAGIDSVTTTIGKANGSFLTNGGKMDDIRLYSRVLSPNEVTQLYNWAPGPIGWWKFDENTGTIASDSSGNNYTGAFSGTPTWINGKYGDALNFNGANEVDATLSIAPGNGNTVEVWVYPTASIASKNLITSSILTTDSSSRPNYGSCVGTAISLNTWTHIAATSTDSTHCTIYQNGILTSSSATTGVSLGTSINIAASSFVGIMDDVRVYWYPRTSKQIVADLNGGHPAGGSAISSMLGYWNLDEQQGQTVHDKGFGGQNLTLGANASSSTDDPTWKVVGSSTCVTNGCQSFDGGDYDQIADNATLSFTGAFTISAWVKRGAVGAGSEFDIASKYDDQAGANQRSFRFYFYQDHLWMAVSSNGTSNAGVYSAYETTNTYTSTSLWYHVVGVFSPSTAIKLYVNGVKQVVTRGEGSGAEPPSVFDGTAAFEIGRRNGVFYNGLIDEVKLYNSALTDSEILIDYNGGAALALGSSIYTTQDNEGSAGNPPVAWWKMDENTGTSSTFDFSGNNYTGTLSGATKPSWAVGKYGSGLSFDGSTSLVTVDNSGLNSVCTSASDFTISSWFKFNAAAGANNAIVFLGKASSANTLCALSTVNGTVRFEYRGDGGVEINGGVAYSTTATYDDRKWHFGAVVKNGTVFKIYVDGIEQKTLTDASSFGVLTTDLQSIGVSRRGATTDSYFNGVIDEAKIYNYARSQSQIVYDYNRGAPLTWYKFDECQGSTAYNSATAGTGLAAGMNATITPNSGRTVGSCSSGVSTEMWNGGTTGKFNSSLNYDGAGDYSEVADTSVLRLTNSLTVSAWVKTTAPFSSTASGLIRKDTQGAGTRYFWGLEFYILSGKVSGEYYNGTSFSVDSKRAINDGSWHQAVLTINATTLSLYVDGVLQGTKTITGTQGAPDGVIDIATNPPTHDFVRDGFLAGQVDDVRIYNYPISAAQVQQIYNNGVEFFGPATGSP